jgi:hypothetical protein
MKMHRCSRCDGFVPLDVATCPNCSSLKKSWWMTPLAFAGAGLASVTLSACYGPGCVSTITKPDGSKVTTYTCGGDYDCTKAPDGGVPVHDSTWDMNCQESDAGTDAGTDAGNPDAGP